jgi:hypothetical protein
MGQNLIYFWQPFYSDFKAKAAGVATRQGLTVSDSCSGAGVIFVDATRTAIFVRDARNHNGQAVIVALISSIDDSEKERQCLECGATMMECIPSTTEDIEALILRVKEYHSSR